MIPIHLETYIIPPGTKLWEPKSPEPPSEEERKYIRSDISWETTVTEALAWFLPDRPEGKSPEFRNDRIEVWIDENGNIEELGISAGITTETIFLVVGAHDQSDFNQGYRTCESWAAEYMQELDWIDIENNIPNIYKDAIRLCAGGYLPKMPSNKLFISMRMKSEYDPEKKEPYPVLFLSKWSVDSSRDWESGHDEIDGFDYEGPAQTMLIPDPEKTHPFEPDPSKRTEIPSKEFRGHGWRREQKIEIIQHNEDRGIPVGVHIEWRRA